MQLAAVYIAVLLIWSTTPLGIVWSSESVSPSLALLLRMSIALVLGSVIIKLAKIPLLWNKNACRFYSLSAIGVAGGMVFTYMGARTIPSGMISLIFGIAPLLSGLFSQKILAEKPFSLCKKGALTVSFIGLFIVCYGKLFTNTATASISPLDLVCILIAVTLFSLSGVLIKSVKINMHPVASTVGTLAISLPFFIAAWLILDGNFVLPELQSRAMYSIIYLGVLGSLFGFVGYFYILKRLSASTVSLVTLVTPVVAIILGSQLNGEIVTDSLIIGSSFILFGLFLFFFGHRAVWVFEVNIGK
jgi:drug/metabolite transporter (DMT)-like permease